MNGDARAYVLTTGQLLFDAWGSVGWLGQVGSMKIDQLTNLIYTPSRSTFAHICNGKKNKRYSVMRFRF